MPEAFALPLELAPQIADIGAIGLDAGLAAEAAAPALDLGAGLTGLEGLGAETVAAADVAASAPAFTAATQLGGEAVSPGVATSDLLSGGLTGGAPGGGLSAELAPGATFGSVDELQAFTPEQFAQSDQTLMSAGANQLEQVPGIGGDIVNLPPGGPVDIPFTDAADFGQGIQPFSAEEAAGGASLNEVVDTTTAFPGVETTPGAGGQSFSDWAANQPFDPGNQATGGGVTDIGPGTGGGGTTVTTTTGGRAGAGGINWGQLAGAGVAGLAGLLTPTPPGLKQLTAGGTQLENQGLAQLRAAQAGQVLPAYQSLQSQMVAQAYQLYANMTGGDPHKDSRYLQTVQNINLQIVAQEEKDALAEIQAATGQLTPVLQANLQANANFNAALARAMQAGSLLNTNNSGTTTTTINT